MQTDGLPVPIPYPGAAWDFIWRMAVCGAGFGLFQSPDNRAMPASAPLRMRRPAPSLKC